MCGVGHCLRQRVADARVGLLAGDGVEHERDLGAVACAQSMAGFMVRVIEAIDPGPGGTGGGASFGDPDGSDTEEPVSTDGGEEVTWAGAGAVGAVDGETLSG